MSKIKEEIKYLERNLLEDEWVIDGYAKLVEHQSDIIERLCNEIKKLKKELGYDN